MREQPQRPFIPHHTPNASAQVVAASEFALSRPFVPGVREPSPAQRESIPTIERFLDMETSLADVTELVPEIPRRVSSDLADESELPPVEHFTDPLPPIAAFAPGSTGALLDDAAYDTGGDAQEAATASPESEWLEDDWQRYDWRAAAALGEAVETEATNDWAATDWEVAPPTTRDEHPTAEAIASALDHIAQRIREGELAVPSPDMLGDPAAIAASVAALLGVKR
ncbi:MAG: hypothetical protein ACRENK_10810 [Gemmatimonadaceae bacterium]